MITLTGPQAATVRQALADAAAYRRERAAAWCGDCESMPEGACSVHVDDLDQADEYDRLAARLRGEVR